jgi:hypothetical protein
VTKLALFLMLGVGLMLSQSRGSMLCLVGAAVSIALEQPRFRHRDRLPRLEQPFQLTDVGVVERDQRPGGDAHRALRVERDLCLVA